MRQPVAAFVAYIKRISVAGALGVALLCVLTNIDFSTGSAEWNPIRDLLANPSSYAMHVVTIRGTLRSLTFVPDFPITRMRLPWRPSANGR